jgi:putative methionine-R-sulfoxide reductase with GAF domain
MTVSTREWAAVASWADQLASAIADRHDHQYVAVVLRDDEAGGLRLAGQRYGGDVDAGRIASGETAIPLDSICGRVFQTAIPALVADVTMDPDYRPFLGTTMRSELTIPIRSDGETVGVVNLESPLISAFGIVDIDDVMARIDDALETFPQALAMAPETG